MPTRAEFRARLGAATSAETLGPLVRGGLDGDRPGPGERFQGDLAEPKLLQAGDDRRARFQELEAGPDLVRTVGELIAAQPAALDVAINLFPKEVGPQLEDLQGAFLEAAFLSTMLLATGQLDPEGRFEPDLDGIIRVAASATPAGQLLRRLFLDPRRQPAPVDPTDAGFPRLPGIDEKLFTTIEALRRKGCAGAVKQALQKWAAAVKSATPRYLENVIDELVPPDNCPGEEMTIRGRDLGDGKGGAVAFTGDSGRVALTRTSDILEWADDHIRLVIPQGAVRGPVGILVFPQVTGEAFSTAGIDAIAEISMCFGPAVTARMTQVIGKVVAPPIFKPELQPNGANLYTGGVPVVDYFEVSPSPLLWPDRKIWLSWSVIGATKLEIVARNVGSSAAQELPAIPGPLPWVSGSVSVTVPGTRPWRGQYVLRAQNRCGTTERPVDLEMVLRRGLALGGGGTRGDFQVGALLYLYDEMGYRPNAIAGTSVGSINAIDLVMGDDTSPARSAAARLAGTWRALVDETSMWGEETWLSNAKSQVRQLLRSLSIEGLLALPYSVVAGAIAASDLSDVFQSPRKRGVVAIFNLGPIETRARAQYDQKRTDASGIKLRLVAISVETGELVLVDESGAVLQRGNPPSRPAAVSAAPTTDVVDGAIASATMPGIFPARRLKDNMCVDGGVKEVVPVQVAVRDLGCNDVIAIRVSARPAALETDPTRPVGEVMTRSVLDLTYDALADDDVEPFGGWGDGVKVTVIRPNLNLHDPMVVEPGLIEIAIDYGWMRAADAVDVPEPSRRYAMQLADKITRLRAENWTHAHFAAGARYRDPHRGFSEFLFAGMSTGKTEIQPVPTPEAVDAVRTNCREIRAALEQRLLISAPTPPSARRTAWFTMWETIWSPPSGNPWGQFISVAGNRPAETPPPPI